MQAFNTLLLLIISLLSTITLAAATPEGITPVGEPIEPYSRDRGDLTVELYNTTQEPQTNLFKYEAFAYGFLRVINKAERDAGWNIHVPWPEPQVDRPFFGAGLHVTLRGEGPDPLQRLTIETVVAVGDTIFEWVQDQIVEHGMQGPTGDLVIRVLKEGTGVVVAEGEVVVIVHSSQPVTDKWIGTETARRKVRRRES